MIWLHVHAANDSTMQQKTVN